MLQFFQPNLYKCLTFHKVKKPIQKNMSQIHEIIKSNLLDYQYYKNYEKQQLNMIDGERALKMNGIKITKECQSFYVQIYSKEAESNKNQINGIQNDRLFFNKTCTSTDPKRMIQILGYSTKQEKYTLFDKLQVYKCPSYGIQIVIYPKKEEIQYIQLSSVSFLEDGNKLHNILLSKLNQYVEEDKAIDLFTLKPKSLMLVSNIQ